MQDEAAEAVDEEITSYSILGKAVFGNFFKILIEIWMCITQWGILISYLIFAGSQFDQIVWIESGHSFWDHTTLFIWISSLIMIPFCWIHTLKKLSYLSLFFSIGMIVSYIMIIYISITIIKQDDKPLSEFNLFSPLQFPFIFGILILVLEGNSASLNIRASMKNAQEFKNWAIFSSTFVMFFYILIGIFWYMAFGDDVNDIVFLSLPETHLSDAIRIMYSIWLLGSFPLQTFPLYHIVEEYDWYKSLPNTKDFDLKFYLSRTLINIMLTSIACIIPKFGLFLDFFGSLASNWLIFIFPVILYEKVF